MAILQQTGAMRLYVWDRPYEVPYGHSMVFCVAHNLKEARKEVAKGKTYSFGYKQPGILNIELGKPTRIVSLPCAEWHEWVE